MLLLVWQIRERTSMACIDKIYSVSAVIGDGSCNANCSFCAGKALGRGQRDIDLHLRNMRNLEFAIKLSARHGGWSLSLTSAGEPTCDPEAITEALTIAKKCADEGAFLPNVNVFTNGILLGDKDYCAKWLPLWKSLGLTNFAISVHDYCDAGQGLVYGVKNYPLFKEIYNNISAHGIGVRATVLLRKGGIDTPDRYVRAIESLRECGFENITSWPVGNPDGSRNQYTPSRIQLFRIKRWIHKNAELAHGHIWGGGVYDYNGCILRFTDYVTRHNPNKNFVRQLVVLQDGGVYYSWITKGAICQKG